MKGLIVVLLAALCFGVTQAQEQEAPGVGASYIWLSMSDGLAETVKLQDDLSHDFQYLIIYQAMGDEDAAFASDFVAQASAAGLTPIVSLEPWSRAFNQRQTPQPTYGFDRIVAGDFDDYFTQWAVAARQSGVQIILRFAQDQSYPQPGWYPWQGDAAGFIGAHRHIVSIFRTQGADNVLFMWSGVNLDQDVSWEYYPGDAWVDLIGTTALNYGTSASWSQWRTFEQLFAPQYSAIVARTTKPIIITQLASSESGGDKAQWLSDAIGDLMTGYPDVDGFIFWEVESDWLETEVNWSIRSTPESYQAVVAALDK